MNRRLSTEIVTWMERVHEGQVISEKTLRVKVRDEALYVILIMGKLRINVVIMGNERNL